MTTRFSDFKNCIFDYDGTIARVPVDWLDARKLFREDVGKRLRIDIKSIKSERLDEMEEELLVRHPDRQDDVFYVRRLLERRTVGIHDPVAATVDLLRTMIAGPDCPRIFIVSNNLRETVLAGLKQLGLTECFQAIYGVDDVGVPKPSTRSAEFLLRDHSVLPCETVFIGDSESTDGEYSRRAGFQFVHVDLLQHDKFQ